MIDGVRIVEVEAADVPRIARIERESRLEPWSEQQFMEELEWSHSRLLAARIPIHSSQEQPGRETVSDCIAGYICFWCVADEIQILNVVVSKPFRRKGIGRHLIEHALGFGCEAGARLAVLEVRKSNMAARNLYEGLGFKVTGERPGYYGVVREPALLMAREIGPYS